MIDSASARNGGGWKGTKAGQCWGGGTQRVCANGDPSALQHIGFAPPSLPREITAGHLAHRPLFVHIYTIVANACLPISAPAKYGLTKLPIVQQVDICEP
jgi:hypothetical protein